METIEEMIGVFAIVILANYHYIILTDYPRSNFIYIFLKSTLPYEQNETIFKHAFEYIKRSERFLVV
jgi:hypothetical protein